MFLEFPIFLLEALLSLLRGRDDDQVPRPQYQHARPQAAPKPPAGFGAAAAAPDLGPSVREISNKGAWVVLTPYGVWHRDSH